MCKNELQVEFTVEDPRPFTMPVVCARDVQTFPRRVAGNGLRGVCSNAFQLRRGRISTFGQTGFLRNRAIACPRTSTGSVLAIFIIPASPAQAPLRFVPQCWVDWRTPEAARLRPACTRATITLRSNSANTPSIRNMALPALRRCIASVRDWRGQRVADYFEYGSR